MPCFRLLTNLPVNQIPKDFASRIVPVLAQAVRKDAKLFTVVLCGDCQVLVAGDPGPAAVATLEAIGHVGPEDNKVTSKEVSQFVHKELGIHPDRFFLSFYDLSADNISRGGTTLAAKKLLNN